MTDLLSERCGDLLTGSYDCPDRIVVNAYYQMGACARRVPGVVAALARRRR
jgi:hypothetical protein